ncbi:MAG: discoidin domain-containing protein [Deltaproteobacteria bacterium]|nr:discoidin domain-containing protein [Deltaproteobacteria bacterium]
MDNDKKDLKYFKSLKYDIYIRKYDDKFALHCADLSLIVEDTNIDNAYEKLESEKEKYFQKMIANGYQNHIIIPKGKNVRKKLSPDLYNFFIKLFVCAAIVYATLATKNTVSRTIKHITNASKDITQISEDMSQVLHSKEKALAEILYTMDKYQVEKEARKQLLNYELVIPEESYASNTLNDYRVKLLFDYDKNTFWHSSDQMANLIFRLDQPSQLKAFSISMRSDVNGKQGPDTLSIEGSNNIPNWEKIAKFQHIEWGSGETKIILLENNSSKYVYYQFHAVNEKGDNLLSIAELELYYSKRADTDYNSTD